MEIHIGDRIADITLVGKEGNKVQLTIDGKPYEVDIVMAENGSCSILHNGNSFNAGLVRGEGGKSYDISMLQRSFHVDIVDTQAKYLHMKKGADEKQGDKILAPMPGKVVSIPVKVGDRLAAGDIAVVLEAMKMDLGQEVKRLKADGGASANNYLLQTQADLTGVQVDRPACVETTAMGAAYLAGLAVGFWKNKEEIARGWKADRSFFPKIEEEVRCRMLKGWQKAVRCSYGWAKDGI